jgi:hypothetical protein
MPNRGVDDWFSGNTGQLVRNEILERLNMYYLKGYTPLQVRWEIERLQKMVITDFMREIQTMPGNEEFMKKQTVQQVTQSFLRKYRAEAQQNCSWTNLKVWFEVRTEKYNEAASLVAMTDNQFVEQMRHYICRDLIIHAVIATSGPQVVTCGLYNGLVVNDDLTKQRVVPSSMQAYELHNAFISGNSFSLQSSFSQFRKKVFDTHISNDCSWTTGGRIAMKSRNDVLAGKNLHKETELFRERISLEVTRTEANEGCYGFFTDGTRSERHEFWQLALSASKQPDFARRFLELHEKTQGMFARLFANDNTGKELLNQVFQHCCLIECRLQEKSAGETLASLRS